MQKCLNLPTTRSYAADIKPDNILVDSDYGFTSLSNTKLCDLGDSAHLDSPKDHVIGAAVYRAPEANFGLPWTTAVDIWSFGATVCGTDTHDTKERILSLTLRAVDVLA